MSIFAKKVIVDTKKCYNLDMLKAVLFDMDGVIVDSEKYWEQEEFSLLKQYIPTWNDEDQKKIIGLKMQDIHEILIRDYNFPLNWEEFWRKADEIAVHIFKNKAELMPGLKDLLKALKAANYKIVLGSSAHRHWIDIVLDRFEIREYFDITKSTQEINGPGKPAPDVYLELVRGLHVAPEECIVIEDSQNGVKAGKSAGMHVIGFRNGINDAIPLDEADIELRGHSEVMQYILG